MNLSVVLITSSNPSNPRFGTGFIIHRSQDTVYVLTCAHVVSEIGGEKLVKVEDLNADVLVSGESKGLDLAVLCVNGLSDRFPLSLSSHGIEGNSCTIIGYRSFGQYRLIRQLNGRLGKAVELVAKDQTAHIKAWDLEIVDKYQLQPGYSGSPVFDVESDRVLGVISHAQENGTAGLAISVDNVVSIWPDAPIIYSMPSGEHLASNAKIASSKPYNDLISVLASRFETPLGATSKEAVINACLLSNTIGLNLIYTPLLIYGILSSSEPIVDEIKSVFNIDIQEVYSHIQEGFQNRSSQSNKELSLSPAVYQVFDEANEICKSTKSFYIRIEHLLQAICLTQEKQSRDFLGWIKVDGRALLEFLKPYLQSRDMFTPNMKE